MEQPGAGRIIYLLDDVLGAPENRNRKQIELFIAILGDKFDFEGRKEFVLYGGAAGGGKSYALRWSCALFLMLAHQTFGLRNVRAGLFCETFQELRSRQISMISKEFPSWLGRIGNFSDIGLAYRLNDEFGAGFITLGNLDKPEKYHSTEFAMAAVDEFTHNKNAGEVFDELRFRLRWPGFPPSFKFQLVAGATPGGPGHGPVKDLWIDRVYPPELETKRDEFLFIPARSLDNHYLTPKYYADLLTLPDDLKEARAFGNWNKFVGQYFSEWRRDVHIVPEFKIPYYWTRFTAEDWGFDHPWCRIWFAISPEGRVIAYREQYQTRKLSEYMAQEGKRLSEGENIKYHVGDLEGRDTGASHGLMGVSVQEELQGYGWSVQNADKNRVAGWQQVRRYLNFERDAKGNVTRQPMFQVMEGTCPNLIRTLPVQVHDKGNPEDLDSDGEDHAVDTLRYALMSRPKLTIIPLEEMPDEYAEVALRMAHTESKRKGMHA